MREVRRDMSLIEFAALAHAELHDAGITTVLSGGAAVDIHSGGGQPSDDLDFVTGHLVAEIEAVLARLGFVRARDPRQSVFTHPLAKWYLEGPAAPLAFGNRTVPMSTQALAVAHACVDEIDWVALHRFVEEEGIAGHRLVSRFSRDAPKSLFP